MTLVQRVLRTLGSAPPSLYRAIMNDARTVAPLFTYKCPVDHDGRPVGWDVWDDLELWQKAFVHRRTWALCTSDETPDFNLGVGKGPRAGRIRRYAAPFRNEFHNKKNFFRHIMPHGLPFVPKTYLDKEQAASAFQSTPIDTEDSVWFFKKSLESRGAGVFAFHSLSDIPQEDLEEEGVFQKGVQDMLLWSNGAKFDLRVVACVTPRKHVYMFETFFARVSEIPYDEHSLERQMQCTNLSQGGKVHVFDDSVHADGAVTDKVANAVRLVMFHMEEFLQEDRFHYFGFDFMLDKKYNPWLLEVNSTPHLYRCNFKGDIVDMMEDLLSTIIEPEICRQRAETPKGSAEAPHASKWMLVSK
eukprot:781085-Prorocentrum_minimum.AAC.5